jgi:hypothetical protein
MFGFLCKNTHRSSTARSAAAATTEVTADVTTRVTAPELTAKDTAAVTAGVTASLASTIASSRIITQWAEPKPFPVPPLSTRTVQIWSANNMPLRRPTAKEVAEELFAAMQKQPLCADKWIPAVCIENVIYPRVCEQLGWPPRPWMGKNGVAAYLAKQSPQRPKYLRVELDGEVHNFQHYYIPEPQTATVSRIDDHRRMGAFSKSSD